MEWYFCIYECPDCLCRYAKRNEKEKYHEYLYSVENTPYMFYRDIARKTDMLIRDKKIEECEKFLCDTSYKYEYIIKYLKSRKSEKCKILEVGCSLGFMVGFLRTIGLDVCGVDISKTAVNAARNTFGNYFSTEIKNEKYDIIYHNGLIGCVDDPVKFIKGLLVLLNENGVMIFNAPNANCARQLNEDWVDTFPPDLVYLFNDDTFDKMIDRSKFIVQTDKRYDFMNIFKKNIVKLSGRIYFKHPISFIKKTRTDHGGCDICRRLFRKALQTAAKFLIGIGLFRKYDHEYGLMIKITKK